MHSGPAYGVIETPECVMIEGRGEGRIKGQKGGVGSLHQGEESG